MLRYAFGIVPAFAQRLSVGVLGGGSLTGGFPTVTVPLELPGANQPLGTRYDSQAKGPYHRRSGRVPVAPLLVLEVDGLYRTMHFAVAGFKPDGSLTSASLRRS
jgi:hypothetical protein